MRRNMVRFVALDFVLRIVFRRVMRMALVVEIVRVNPDDRAVDEAGLRIPGNVVADLEALSHCRLQRPHD